MDYFDYRDGRLFCEGVDIAQIAEEVGTPAYIYSGGTLLHHYGAMAEAFAPLDPLICFAVKALGNVHILKAGWNDLFEEHFTRFDGQGGSHDDIVDAAGILVHEATKPRGGIISLD